MYTVNLNDDQGIEFSGTVASDQVISARKEIESLIEAHDRPAVVVNLSGLESYNSQVLSLCLCVLRKAKSCHIELTFKSPPERLFNMARVGGLEFIFSDSH